MEKKEILLLVLIVIISSCTQQVINSNVTQTNSTANTSLSVTQLQKICEDKKDVWCNDKCYPSCSEDQKSFCPSSGEMRCIIPRSPDDIKKSIVYLVHNVSGCCNDYSQIYPINNVGSGVIYSKTDETIYVLTSRHNIDCVFAGTCLYPKSENISIFYNNKSYTPAKALFAPDNLDLVILEIQTNEEFYPVLTGENYSTDDVVTMVSYIDANITSVSGRINSVYNLTNDTSFDSMQIDSLTSQITSGGGVFDQYGHLIGIISWENIEQKRLSAISIISLSDIENSIKGFSSCSLIRYKNLGEGCCNYGYIYGSDGVCHESCGIADRYCLPPNVCCNGMCYEPCIEGYYRADNCGCAKYIY